MDPASGDPRPPAPVLDIDRAFFPGAGRAVVTGAAGFIGSHLAAALLEQGRWVIGVDSCGGDPGLVEQNLRPLLRAPKFVLVRGDLAELALRPLLDGVDTVFHLAAKPGVRTSWGEGFAEYVRSNVLATHRLLDAATAVGVRRLVISSSSSVYGPAPAGPLAETRAPEPISPYAVTKVATEQLALAHAHRSGHQPGTVLLRYFTVYGPRQRPDMAISRMIRSALTGEPFTVFGDGAQRRDFTYVGDIVRGNLLAAAADLDSTVLNVGSGRTISIAELIELVGDVVGRPVVTVPGPPADGDVAFTHADLDRAAALIGYRPLVDLRAGLAHQVAAVSEGLVSEGLVSESLVASG